jgi:SAM-dependent methyltransferase
MSFQLFRWIRNKLSGLNANMVRFDRVENKLDEMSARMSLPEVPVENTTQVLRAEGTQLPEDRREKFSSFTPLEENEVVRIAFLIQDLSIWPSLRSVWVAASKDPRFVSKVVLTPFIHPFSSEAIKYDDLKNGFLDEGVSFCAFESFDLAAFSPHVTFLQNPYEDTRPEALRIEALKKAGTRIAYIPYGLEMGGGAWNISVQFNSYLHRSAWMIFARSERHKKMFGKYCSVGNDHVVVSGHPKFDMNPVDSAKSPPNELTRKIAERKVILWTPHFAVGDPPTWSTFRIYGETILDEIQRRQDLFLLIRPHPLFFQAMLQHGIWDKTGEERFRAIVLEGGNLALDEKPDYRLAFSISDALMADVGSFLLEYLPTGKPILYLHHPEGIGMNEDEELVSYLYTAWNPSDIAEFMDMVGRGEDGKREGRELAVKSFLHGINSNVGEQICHHIYSSLRAGEARGPCFLERVSKEQSVSERFWEKANCTYLAPPDYYDRKEAILKEILGRLPRFRKAIDIGSGDGRFTLLLARYADEVIGYELSPALIEKAKEAATKAECGNATFLRQEMETIAPCEKFDLVSCMGVTSCILEDTKFLRMLDKFRMLCRRNAFLLMVDTLSTAKDQIVSDQTGYIAKYRNAGDYLNLIGRRGFVIRERVRISEMEEKNLINDLFVFGFEDLYASSRIQRLECEGSLS